MAFSVNNLQFSKCRDKRMLCIVCSFSVSCTRMNNLFDDTERTVKIIRNPLKELKIKGVLNPYNQTFIDEQYAIDFGIIFNGYYRNW